MLTGTCSRRSRSRLPSRSASDLASNAQMPFWTVTFSRRQRASNADTEFAGSCQQVICVPSAGTVAVASLPATTACGARAGGGGGLCANSEAIAAGISCSSGGSSGSGSTARCGAPRHSSTSTSRCNADKPSPIRCEPPMIRWKPSSRVTTSQRTSGWSERVNGCRSWLVATWRHVFSLSATVSRSGIGPTPCEDSMRRGRESAMATRNSGCRRCTAFSAASRAGCVASPSTSATTVPFSGFRCSPDQM